MNASYEKVTSLEELAKNTDKTAQSLSEISLISFDFFDTLFGRPLTNPEDLFDIMGERFGIPNFRTIRKSSQAEAFQKMHQRGGNEITVEDIYECLPQCDICPAELMKAEIELELSILKPIEEVFSLFKSLRDNGWAVCITSDMYLGESFFKRILKAYDLHDIPLYISSTCNATKRDRGELFNVLTKRSGIPAERILHIGDNYTADVQRAKESGINALHYQPKPELLVTTCPSLGTSLATGLLHYNKNGITPNSFKSFGYIFGGPATVGFLHWIAQRAKTDSIDKLLFISRDGYMLDQINHDVDHLDLPSSTYFYGSRTAFTLAAMNSNNFEEFIPFLLSGAEGLSPEELLERIGVHAPSEDIMKDLALDASVKISTSNHHLLTQFLHAYRWEILKICQRNRRAYFQYFNKLGIKAGMRIAIIDVGWSGTTQEAFERMVNVLFDAEVIGYYFCLADTPERLARENIMKMHSMINSDEYPAELVAQIHINRVAIELLFSAPHNSIIGLYPSLESIQPLHDAGRGESSNLNHTSEEINAGILDFYHDFSSMAQYGISTASLISPAIELATNVHKSALDILLTVKGFDAWGSSRNHK